SPGAYQGVLQIQAAQGPVTSLVSYWYAVGSQTPAYLTVLDAPQSGTHGSRQTIFFRISDSVGVAVFMDAVIKATSGGGSVFPIQYVDDTYPGVYEPTVHLGPEVMDNIFHISVGSLAQDVTITGN